MARIGSLLIDIKANVASLQKDMRQARSTLDGAVSRMSKSLKAFGGAVAGYFAADAIIAFGRRTVESAAMIARSAEQIGVTTTALQELRYAASTVGVQAEDLDQILRDLGDRMGDAASGSASWREAFAALGVEIRDGAGRMRAVEEVFLDVADGMRNADSDATRLFRSMELFSDQGARLLPLLNQGSDGIARLRQEARDLGIVMDESTAESAVRLQANIDRLGLVGQTVAAGVMEELAPALIQVSEQLLSGARSGGTFSKVVTTGFKLVASAVQIVAQIFNHFGKTIGGVAAALVELFSGNFQNAWRIASDARNDVFSDWADLGTNLSEIWSDLEKDAAAGGTAVDRSLVRPLRRAASAAKGASDAIRELAERTRAELGMAPGEKFGEAITAENLEDRRWREFQEGWSTRDRPDDLDVAEHLKPTKREQEEIANVGGIWAESFSYGFGEALGRADTKGLLGTALRGLAGLLPALVGGPVGGLLGGLGSSFLGALGFASGGAVIGPGGPTSDAIPALLSNGEYVINARSARRLGRRFLDAVNSLGRLPMNGMPAFASGGAVGGWGAAGVAGAVYVDQRRVEIAAFDPRSMYEAAGVSLAPALYRRSANRSDPKLTSQQRRALATPRMGRVAR